MMKKKLTVLLLILLSGLILLFSGNLIAGDDPEDPPEEVVINNEGYRQDRKGPVTLSHQSHAEDYDVACTECHHDYDDGKNTWQEGDPVTNCFECHDPIESDGNVKKLMVAYHKNCIGCHKRMKKEGISEDAPYKKCYECHEKKK